jgi:hypothetical protein
VEGLPALAGEEHVCAECGVRYVDLDPGTLGALVDDFAAAVAACADPRGRSDGWSVAEYACHVRDVLVTYTIRLHRARVEDRPQVEPMYNDLRARRFDYRHADPAATVAEARAAARGLAAEVGRVRDWDRTVTRLPGEERTARWLVRQALHEVHHHTRDIRLRS